MDNTTYERIVKHLEQMGNKEITKKRPSYTIGSNDVLANFKRNASVLGINPLLVWAVYTTKHLDSILAYIKSGVESNETIDGRFTDLYNYIKIGYALYIEEKNKDLPFYEELPLNPDTTKTESKPILK